MSEGPEIVHLDTWTITGQTVYDEKGRARIEISEYLKQYPELLHFVLNHEIDHAKNGPVSWRHLWIDFRDRPKLIWDDKLREQKRQFENCRRDLSLKTQTFYLIYVFFCVLQAIGVLLPLAIIKFVAGMLRRKTKT